MADAGEVKAKVTVEYEDNGSFEKAQQKIEDTAGQLAKLTEQAGNASNGMAQLEGQAGKTGEGVAQLAENASSLEKPMQTGETVVSELTDALGEHQAALEQAGESYKALAEPLGTTVAMLENAGPPMLAIGEHAQAAAEQLGPVGESFAQIGESLQGAVPLLPDFADSMRVVDSTLAGSSQRFTDFHENMAVFQDALVNPEPFSVVESHLAETGQSWSEFATSVGEDNMHILRSMNQVAMNAAGGLGLGLSPALTPEQLAAIGPEVVWDQTASSIVGASTAASDAVSPFAALNETMVSTGKGAGAVGPQMIMLDDTVSSFGKAAGDATPQFVGMNEAMTKAQEGINKFGGVGSAQYGPENAFGGSLGLWIERGGLEGAGNFFNGLMMSMNSIAMPLMAVQMIGMAVQTVSAGIYNAAATAEGPAAHSLGTFTGAIDTMAQSSAKAGQQFSESFGQQLLPTLDAINNVNSQNGSGGLWEGIGGTLGGIGTILTIGGSALLGGGMDALGTLLTDGQQNTWGEGFINIASQGVQNEWASIHGQPLPYPGPAPQSQAQLYTQQQMPLVAQNVDMLTAQSGVQAATLLAEATNPAYLQAQDQTMAAQTYLQRQQAQYNSSHYISPSQLASAAMENYYTSGDVNAMPDYSDVIRGEMTHANGGRYGGGIDPNAIWAQQMLNPGMSYQDAVTRGYDFGTGSVPGCFPAGTRVRMAVGNERSIESLQVGEQVLGHDGTAPVATVVLARIIPPPRQTYELIFSDGNTLTLTDSHPIATRQGWKSLSPAATERENPGLAVTVLTIGDHVYTADDNMCELTAIQAREIVQVYNIEVDDPHTFYANSVLVHNKSYGQQIMQNVADTQIPQTDLRGSNLMSSLTSNFSTADLSHTFTATVNWATSGELAHTFEGIANWVAQGGLEHVFEGVASWLASGELAHTFLGIVDWLASGELSHTFLGVVNWFASGGLEHTFEGVASWLGQELEHLFTGKASWIGQDLEHVFTATAQWIGQNLNPVFNVAASFIGIPGFAGGVENYSGGWSVVGENGPELLNLPQGSSVYPMDNSSGGAGANLSSLAGGGGGNGTPSSINVAVHLDSQTLVQALGMPLSQNIRVGMGLRGY